MACQYMISIPQLDVCVATQLDQNSLRARNNMVERLHGTIRERNKVMRGLDEEKTAQAIVDGFRIYYNFIRPHMALNGKIPAKQAGIDMEFGNNKWLSLIKQASGARAKRF